MLSVQQHTYGEGIYFITFSVNDTPEEKKPCSSKEKCPVFFMHLPDYSVLTIPARVFGRVWFITRQFKYLITILNAEPPGWYNFKVFYQNEVYREAT